MENILVKCPHCSNLIIINKKEFNCKIITTEKDYLRLDNNKYNEIKYIKSKLKILNENKFLKEISKLYEQN